MSWTYGQYREARPDLLSTARHDLGNLDLYRWFDLQVPARVGGHKGSNVHRCHLAEDYLRVFDLDHDPKEYAVSAGVRDSLRLLMTSLSGRTWAIPSDQYPWYLAAADRWLPSWSTFLTDPRQPSSATGLDPGSSGPDVVVLCYPMKPFGVPPSDDLRTRIRAWLAADGQRLLVIDAAYALQLDDPWLDTLRRSGQCAVLHSLSKPFGAPLRAGFAHLPDPDLREVFKGRPRWSRMEEAFVLLNQVPDAKEEMAEQLRKAHRRTAAVVPGLPDLDPDNPSYLYHLPTASWTDLRAAGILTVPASVFGITSLGAAEGVVVSTLGSRLR